MLSSYVFPSSGLASELRAEKCSCQQRQENLKARVERHKH